jgi:hypothetical protein
MLYFIIVNIKVMMKNAKIEVAGLGGALEEFVVGNVSGDGNCASIGGGAGGIFVVVVVGVVVVVVGVVVVGVGVGVVVVGVVVVGVVVFVCVDIAYIYCMYNMYKLIYKNNIIM